MAQDLFSGSANPIATNDTNWALGSTSEGETLSDLRADGSGFCIQNNGFGSTSAFYTGTTEAAKSEIVIPQNAFSSANAGDRVGVFCCGGTGTRGLSAEVRQTDLTAQVVNTVFVQSNTSFVTNISLAPTIDLAAGPMTMSVQRTSATNLRVIVNGTTYNADTTGLDIASGTSGIRQIRNNSSATTMKIDSWTDGVVAAADTVIAWTVA